MAVGKIRFSPRGAIDDKHWWSNSRPCGRSGPLPTDGSNNGRIFRGRRSRMSRCRSENCTALAPMSISATRTLIAIGVLAAGGACAGLFRKDASVDRDAVHQASRETSPHAHWQAAAYPDAISLPRSEGSVGRSAARSPLEAAIVEPAQLVGQRYPTDAETTLMDSPESSERAHPDVKRLPASIGSVRIEPQPNPLGKAVPPPSIAPRYGDVRPDYETTFRLPSAAVASGGTHSVRDGDTLASIAQKYLGNLARADEIYELNRELLPEPDVLPIGAELRLPPANGAFPARGPATSMPTTAAGGDDAWGAPSAGRGAGF